MKENHITFKEAASILGLTVKQVEALYEQGLVRGFTNAKGKSLLKESSVIDAKRLKDDLLMEAQRSAERDHPINDLA